MDLSGANEAQAPGQGDARCSRPDDLSRPGRRRSGRGGIKELLHPSRQAEDWQTCGWEAKVGGRKITRSCVRIGASRSANAPSRRPSSLIENFLMTVIVHYGAGNLRSVMRALERLGEPGLISSDPAEVRRAKRLILPGVGSFDTAMATLRQRGLVEALAEQVQQRKVPILGICLGLQLFTRRSDEGRLPGLGWIAGETRRFQPADPRRKVPHIGWNAVYPQRESPLLAGLPTVPALYFVHSYYVTCDDPQVVLATSTYDQQFVSVVQADNLFGVQFHPERSQQVGLDLLANFLRCT